MPPTAPVPIDPAVLAAPVAGLHLRPGTFADQLDPAPGTVTLLVFLRHHG